MANEFEQLDVFTKAQELIIIVYKSTDNSPKKYRHDLIADLKHYSSTILKRLLLANDVYVAGEAGRARLPQRYQLQKDAQNAARHLGIFAQIALDLRCIIHKDFFEIVKRTAELQNRIGAWINSDKERFDKSSKSN